MLELGLKSLLAYLIGALNGSLVLGLILGGPDVRSVGSGNAGGTNALRARGKWFALGVMLIDVGKGYFCVTSVAGMSLAIAAGELSVGPAWIAFACAGSAVVGHCYPVWFGFEGGKGAATAVGVLAGLAPGLLLPGLAVWLIVVGLTGFVGLATILAMTALPIAVIASGITGRYELLVFLIGLALFIVYTHRSNVARMLRGEENRMSRLMVLRRSH